MRINQLGSTLGITNCRTISKNKEQNGSKNVIPKAFLWWFIDF